MIFKRGQTYWYKFASSIKERDGAKSFLIRRSARTKIGTEAVEREHRRSLRLGEIHPLDPWPKPPVPEAPSLRDFSTRFLEYAKLHVKESSFTFYKASVPVFWASRNASSGKSVGEKQYMERLTRPCV